MTGPDNLFAETLEFYVAADKGEFALVILWQSSPKAGDSYLIGGTSNSFSLARGWINHCNEVHKTYAIPNSRLLTQY